MAISLVGKIVIVVVSLAVAGGLVTTFVLLARDNAADDDTTPAPEATSASTEPPSESTSPEIEITTAMTTAITTPWPIDTEAFLVGVGIADMTGPCTEINFMGYANLEQSGSGIHLRQFSRAFIFVKNNNVVVLVTADVQAVGVSVRREVVRNLQELYGNTYNLNNVIITGTHTHSAPGGHLVDFLFDVTILGHSRESFNAYVSGITRSIVRAHENMVPARLFYAQTTVTNAHINRSPYSYLSNPEEERNRYTTNTDQELTQLRIVKEDGTLHGVLNWFAVHPTSMNMDNTLISSDNLGYAAVLLEKQLNPGAMVGKPEIVAGFFSSNLGDVSPNIAGARCEFSGQECDDQFLVCAANERCFALGPGEDMFESTSIIATRVYEGAVEALNSEGVELFGDVAVLHQFVDMPQQTVAKYNPITMQFDANEQVSGCVPALGYSFAAGTMDGANTLNLTQGMLEGIPEWADLAAEISLPTPEDIQCHSPKPIFLATGRATTPYEWHPTIVSASLIWLGGLVIAGVPGEPSTMAGRRIKTVVGNLMQQSGFEPRVVVSGLTNEYTQYVTTFEEYQIQRYEGASTIYGPHTLDIYLNKFAELTTAVIQGSSVAEGPSPADFRDETISLITPVLSDLPPEGSSFGDLVQQPETVVSGGQTVTATFIGANPRNDLRQELSHATVERLVDNQWMEVATDADWETKFSWERISLLFATSTAKFEWTVPSDATPGTYRMVYYGTSRRLIGTLTPFTAISNNFTVQ